MDKDRDPQDFTLLNDDIEIKERIEVPFIVYNRMNDYINPLEKEEYN